MAIRYRTRSQLPTPAEPAGEVGYGKPPTSSRFKPGQSGNPKGRPHKTLALDPVLSRILAKKVAVARNGSTTTLSLLEAIIEQLTLAAAKGNGTSQRLVLNLVAARDAALAEAEATAANRPEQISDSSDEETLALYREEIRAEVLSEFLDKPPSRGPYIKKIGKK